MAKKKGKGKKSSKPAWLSDNLYQLISDFTNLVESYKGTQDKSAVPIVISRSQAGLYIWQLVYSNDKKSKAKREEAIKLECIETSVKLLSSQDTGEATAAAGILAAIITTEQYRDQMLSARPAPIPPLLNALTQHSTSYRCVAASLIFVLATSPDTRPRVLKATKEWDFSPLLSPWIGTESLQSSMHTLGARHAARHAMASIEAMLQPPPPLDAGGVPGEKALVDVAHQNVLAAGAVKHLIQMCLARMSHPQAKSHAMGALQALMEKGPCQEAARQQFGEFGGVHAALEVMQHEKTTLVYKASAAACIFRYLLPSPSMLATSDLISAVHVNMSQTGQGNEHVFGKGGALEQMLQRDAGCRDELLVKVQETVEAGAIPPLVSLCVGPDGPRQPLSEEELAKSGKKKKGGKKKGKKGKKGKMEPGMADAQVAASGCLRLMSLKDGCKEAMVDAGALQYLSPLLDSKVDLARWNARQALLNLAMQPTNVTPMVRLEVPNYITGANMPKPKPTRPFTAPPKLDGLPQDLANPIGAAKMRPQTSIPKDRTHESGM